MHTINNLLSFISKADFAQLASETKVDKHAKKLQGELLFKLLLYCMVTEKDTSLRGMQSALETTVFRALANISGNATIAHSSISERLNTINPIFFEKIYKQCLEKYCSDTMTLSLPIVRFDSTIVSLSTSLIKIGYNLKGGDAKNFRLLKFTVGYSNLPECICFYTDQTYNSENIALTETILGNQRFETQINVFDRGITARHNYDKLTEKKLLFVSRINTGAKKEIINKVKITSVANTKTLKIINDNWAYLFGEGGKKSIYPVRIIEAVTKADGGSIMFTTNIKDLNAAEITEIYKSRWEIEVFFKFIKQHLNFSHLLNRTENGIKVVMYVTMTLAILLTEYKKLKNLEGYKIPKRKFAQDLENDLIYALVILCNGNKQTAERIIYRNTS
jgi:Transposase DDE domain